MFCILCDFIFIFYHIMMWTFFWTIKNRRRRKKTEEKMMTRTCNQKYSIFMDFTMSEHNKQFQAATEFRTCSSLSFVRSSTHTINATCHTVYKSEQHNLFYILFYFVCVHILQSWTTTTTTLILIWCCIQTLLSNKNNQRNGRNYRLTNVMNASEKKKNISPCFVRVLFHFMYTYNNITFLVLKWRLERCRSRKKKNINE